METANRYGLSLEFLERVKSLGNVDIYIDTEEYCANDNVKIYLQNEPNEYHACYKYLSENSHKYDYIITYNKKNNINTKIPVINRICGGTWILPEYYKNIDITNKRFVITGIFGSKIATHLHYTRHLLWFNQIELKKFFPLLFYRSGAGNILNEINENPIIPAEPLTTKTILFKNAQFHLCLENSAEINYFSEKIIDCLIMKCIPIYYGCKNIGEYFNTKGWILIDTSIRDNNDLLNEFVAKMKILNDDYYNQYISVITENYERAIQFSSIEENTLLAFRVIPDVYVADSKL